VPKSGSLGSVRGAGSNACPYRENAEQACASSGRLAHSVGVSPTGVRVGAWVAGWRETETLKPTDKAIERMVASHQAVATANVKHLEISIRRSSFWALEVIRGTSDRYGET
jgi:hypothetical protein